MAFKLGFKTTRYYHYFTQYSDEINGSYIDDPIATYAASAIALGGDVGTGIINNLQSGRGINLKRYYQYAKVRFGNRFWNWELSTRTGNTVSNIDAKRLANILGNKSKNIYVASSNLEEFNPLGPYINAVIRQKFGIHEFNTTYKGKQFASTSVMQTSKGYTVLKNVTDKDPEYLYLDELPEPSKGIIYWEASEPVKKQDVEDTVDQAEYILYAPPKYPTELGEKVLVKEWLESYNPFGSTGSNDTNLDGKTGKELDTEQKEESEITVNYSRTIYKRYAELVHKIRYQRGYKYYYTITEEQWEITYDTEKIVYVTESGKTNSETLKYFLESSDKRKPRISGKLSSKDPMYKNAFELYPYLPLQDFGSDAWSQIWVVPKLGTNSEIVKLQRAIDKATKDDKNAEYEAEINEPNQINPSLKRRNKNKTRKKDTKEVTYEGKTYTVRALRRKLARYMSQKRKIKFNKLTREAKPLTEEATKRHIDNLSDMLGVDYESIATSMFANPDYSRAFVSIKGRNIMPAVNFSSPLAEVQAYWFYLFKRLYKMYGEERDYVDWVNAVQNANSFYDLPMKQLNWTNQSKLDAGSMAWLYIKKTTIKGKIRKVKRIKGIKEIKRGLPITVNSIDELKEIIEPQLSLANDEYYTSKNNTEHCIGGQKYTGGGATWGLDITNIMQDFNYTFFCRQSGKDELEVYAVAGLCFSTKMIRTGGWANAWYDLELQYSRNKNRYGKSKNHEFSATSDYSVRINKRHYYITKVSHFGVMPIDYNVIRRIGGTELERLAVRVPLLYGFTHAEQKRKSKSYVRALKVIPIIVYIAVIIFTIITAGAAAPAGQALAAAVAAVIKAVITSVLISLASKHLLMPLLKSIGIKGIAAAIINTIILIVAMLVGGQVMDAKSALPVGSEVGKETATQTAAEVAKNTANTASNTVNTIASQAQAIANISKSLGAVSEGIKQSAIEALKYGVKEGFKQGLSELTKVTAFKVLTTLSSSTFAGLSAVQQENLADIQYQAKVEQEKYGKAISELEELQEAFDKIPYDVKTVLEHQRLRFRMYDPSLFLTSNTQPDTFSGSFDFLSNFFNMKLNVDPATTDVAMTPDFSFANPYNTNI